jgi:hypothetical protein
MEKNILLDSASSASNEVGGGATLFLYSLEARVGKFHKYLFNITKINKEGLSSNKNSPLYFF